MENTQPQPQQGSPEENPISDFVDQMKLDDVELYQRSVKKARNILVVTAVLVLLGEMIAMFSSEDGFTVAVFVTGLAEAGIFLALALWTKKKPYTAVVTGISVFIGLHVLVFASNAYFLGAGTAFATLFSGFLIKAIIIGGLVKTLRDVKIVQEHRKDLPY